MSAKKRRVNRKIAQLVRMDSQSKRMPVDRMAGYWASAIVPLAVWICRRKKGWRLLTAVFRRMDGKP